MPGTGFFSDFKWATPGFGARIDTVENDCMWGRYELLTLVGGNINGAARDAGSTPTTLLRSGLVMMQATDGTWTNYDGTLAAGGILVNNLSVVDLTGANQNLFAPVAVGGLARPSALYGLTEQARADFFGRFIFEDRGFAQGGYVTAANRPTAKVASYTLIDPDDSGKVFTNRGAAGAVTFTLPTTLRTGFRARFYVEADQNVIIAAPAGKLVAFNNAAATSIAFQTTAKRIGNEVEISVNDNASKYLTSLRLADITAVETIA